MKPIFVVGGLYSRANGVAWIMRDLAAALGRAGAPVDVYGADCYGRGASSIGEIFEPPSRWITAKGLWLGALSWSPGIRALLEAGIQRADVVHNHSLWMLPNSYASRIAQRLGKPVVITAHGALEPWAMQHSGWKKQLVGKWFQFRDLEEASCLHVNSLQEMEGIRALGYRNPVAVIPNGIHLPDFQDLPDRSAFRDRWPALKDKKILLFMARLHQKKGLDHLLKAWAQLRVQFADWHLVVAGPDDGFQGTACQLIEQLGLDHSVTLTGNLQGEQKREALAAADFFVQPSFSEGFSMSIVEALACQLPVLMTPRCNFQEAARVGAAVEVEPTVESTRDGLLAVLSLSNQQREHMGQVGYDLVRAGYTWDMVAAQTLNLYRWLHGSGTRPNFVYDA